MDQTKEVGQNCAQIQESKIYWNSAILPAREGEANTEEIVFKQGLLNREWKLILMIMNLEDIDKDYTSTIAREHQVFPTNRNMVVQISLILIK